MINGTVLGQGTCGSHAIMITICRSSRYCYRWKCSKSKFSPKKLYDKIVDQSGQCLQSDVSADNTCIRCTQSLLSLLFASLRIPSLRNDQTWTSTGDWWGGLTDVSTGDLRFPTLSKPVKGLLAITHGNADVESLFSQVNLIKTKMRNKMHADTLDMQHFDCQSEQGGTVP